MFCPLFESINYIPVLISAAFYFVLGAVWFSPMLFGNMWRDELEKHNVTIKNPTAGDMICKVVMTNIFTIIASFAMAFLVAMTNSTTLMSGLFLGKLVAAFSAVTLAIAYTWESRSVKLFLIDIGYPIVGIMTSAVILSLWR